MSQITGTAPAINSAAQTTAKIAGLVVNTPPSPAGREPAIKPKPSSVTIAPSAAEQIRDLVHHVYLLGPRPIFEAICAVHGGADVIETLQAYQRLNPDVVRFLGADRLRHRRARNGCRHEN